MLPVGPMQRRLKLKAPPSAVVQPVPEFGWEAVIDLDQCATKKIATKRFFSFAIDYVRGVAFNKSCGGKLSVYGGSR
jgi:hypothetical protein